MLLTTTATFFSFDVISNTLVFRKHLSLVPEGYGGVDLAIDDEYNILFMSSENTSTFEIVDAQELNHINQVDFGSPVNNITGIVYDSANQRILGTKRNTNTLYSILWNPQLQTLTLEEPYIELDNIQRACDLAINGDVLYVSEYQYSLGGSPPTSKKIHTYDMSDDFTYIETINMDDYVVSMDYNAADDSIYGGSWKERGSESNQHIIKRTFDPNYAMYDDYNDPNSSYYVSQTMKANWEPICNLDDTGDSAYTIDIDDFVIFCEDWLWIACWHEKYNEIWMMSSMAGGGESMLMLESTLAVDSSRTFVPEKPLEEQLADAEVIIAWLDEVSKEKDFFDYIDKKLWKEFVDSIYDWLSDLEAIVDDKYSY